MSEKANWFSTGAGEVKKAQEQMKSQFKPEFWLKDGESAKVIVLDKEPFNIRVHSVKIRGKFKKYTCLCKNCPLCKVSEARFVSVFRIIDTRSYEDKQGKTHKNQERYWEIGTRMYGQVESLEEEKQFYGKLLKVKRTGSDNKTTYSITCVGDPEKKYKPTLKIIEDYKPKSVDELKMLAGLLGAEDDEDDDKPAKTNASRYYEEDDDDQAEEKPKNKKFDKKAKPVDPEEEEDDDDQDGDDDEPADDDEGDGDDD